jgi:hypothetical protein
VSVLLSLSYSSLSRVMLKGMMKVQEVTRESAKGRNRASANYWMKGNIHERDDEKERMNVAMKMKE